MNYRHTLITPAAGVRGLILALLLTAPRTAYAASDTLCVRNASAMRGTWAINGIVAGGVTTSTCSQSSAQSEAWGRAAPYNLVVNTTKLPTGNASAGGTISFTDVGGHLYIGFTMHDDHDLSDFDQVFVFFDRLNDGDTWAAGDFYLKVTVGPGTPQQTPVDPMAAGPNGCSLSATVEVFKWTGSAWEGNGPLAASVSAKAAYDYDQTIDAEHNLWNLEIDLTVAPFGLTTSKFAMGTYVFLDDNHGQTGVKGNVLRWPESLAERAMGDGDFTISPLDAATLANLKFGDQCFDVRFTAAPLTSNSMTEVNATGPTTFKMWYYVDGPGDTETSGADSGDVRIVVYRYTATTSWQTIFTDTKKQRPSTYNSTHSTTFTMSSPPPSGSTDFCSDIYVESNWPLDDDRSDGSNHVHVNYIPFGTSEVTKEVDLSVDSVPARASSTDLVLHIYTTNDPAKRVSVGHPPRGSAPVILVGGLLLGVAVAGRRRRMLASLSVALGMVAIISGCPKPGGQAGPIGTARWSLANAGELGLTPIAGQPGWYRMPGRRGQLKRARFQFTGQPLPYRTVSDTLRMAADSTGRPVMMRVPAKAGQVVSVFALGKVDVDGPDGPLPPADANGVLRPVERPQISVAVAAPVTYLLGRGEYAPAENVGTLVGSFDGFKTSFLIGTNSSFVVPRGAEQLMIAVNGSAFDYRRATGAYLIKWLITSGPSLPTANFSGIDAPLHRPFRLYGWDVLSSVHLVTYYEAEQVDPKTYAKAMGLGKLGEAHMSIYETH